MIKRTTKIGESGNEILSIRRKPVDSPGRPNGLAKQTVKTGKQ
jgi:hypothetical protein